LYATVVEVEISKNSFPRTPLSVLTGVFRKTLLIAAVGLTLLQAPVRALEAVAEGLRRSGKRPV